MHAKTLTGVLLWLLLIVFGICFCCVLQPWFVRTKSQIEARTAASAFLEQYQTQKQAPIVQPSESPEVACDTKNAAGKCKSDAKIL